MKISGNPVKASFFQRMSDEGDWLMFGAFWLSDAYDSIVNGDMTVEEALEFFENVPTCRSKLETAGLGTTSVKQLLLDLGLLAGLVWSSRSSAEA